MALDTTDAADVFADMGLLDQFVPSRSDAVRRAFKRVE